MIQGIVALLVAVLAGVAVFHYQDLFTEIRSDRFAISDYRFIENHLIDTTSGGKPVKVLDKWVPMQDGRTLNWGDMNLLEVVFTGMALDGNGYSDISVSVYLVNEELKLADYDDWKKITNPNEWIEKIAISRYKDQISDYYKLERGDKKIYKLKGIIFSNKEKFEGKSNFLLRVVARDNNTGQMDAEQLKIELR